VNAKRNFFLGCLALLLVAAIATVLFSSSNQGALSLHYLGYTNEPGFGRSGRFLLHNSGKTPVSILKWMHVQQHYTAPPRTGNHPLTLQPKESAAFTVTAPQQGRWQLAVFFYEESVSVKIRRWYHGTRFAGIVGLKDTPAKGALSEWVENTP
jgi:hypothetical protein